MPWLFSCLLFIFLSSNITSSKTCTLDGNGVCNLSCSGTDSCKDSNLYCQSGYDCTMNCIGDNSCAGNTHIYGIGAIHVTITCKGYNSCEGNTIIDCGKGQCDIICTDITSCKDTEINSNEAIIFKCSPTTNCNEASSIPAPYIHPTLSPTSTPTLSTSTISPSLIPTNNPTKSPSNIPTTYIPTFIPSITPTNNPSNYPSILPTKYPITDKPSFNPITLNPSLIPTISPTQKPSLLPTDASAQIIETTVLVTIINTINRLKSDSKRNNSPTMIQYIALIISVVILCFCIGFIGYLVLRARNKNNDKQIPLLNDDGININNGHKIKSLELENINDKYKNNERAEGKRNGEKTITYIEGFDKSNNTQWISLNDEDNDGNKNDEIVTSPMNNNHFLVNNHHDDDEDIDNITSEVLDDDIDDIDDIDNITSGALDNNNNNNNDKNDEFEVHDENDDDITTGGHDDDITVGGHDDDNDEIDDIEYGDSDDELVQEIETMQ